MLYVTFVVQILIMLAFSLVLTSPQMFHVKHPVDSQ